jgi:glycerol-3-phosphate dehydrogenase subunit B
MTHLLIVGGGLTGLFAAVLAAERSADVTLVTQGRGGLGVSHGCLDVWARGSPGRRLRNAPQDHPYSKAGADSFRGALEAFRSVVQRAGYPFVGRLSRNMRLPTALGAVRTTAFAPRALAAGALDPSTPFTLAEFKEFRDFYPRMAAANLRRAGLPVQGVVGLPLIDLPRRRDFDALDLARKFEDRLWREEIARAWKPNLTGVKRLGLPAVLGLAASTAVAEDLQEQLGVPVFEIPTLPPSVPGLRLERILRSALLEAGGQILEGPHVIGRVEGRSDGRRVSGVVSQTPGGPRVLTADAVLLATGGILHGGLVAMQDGRVQESVFDLPVIHNPERELWTAASALQGQPFARFGLAVDEHMRPLGADGLPVFENLFAAGGILAGADRTQEGSRQGVDLATAYRAVEVALA